jgi:integrase
MINREGKSLETLRRYLEGVQTFTEYMKADSPDLALEKLRGISDITEALDQYVDSLIAKGFTPINVKAHWFGVKKWLTANRVNGIDYEYISRPKVSTRIRDRIPTKDELRLILSNKISLRDQAFFMVALSSGLRIGTLATLKVKDYEPIEDLGMITVEGGPNRKLANGKSFFTFITSETRKVLENYLKTRESLNPDDPLFAKDNGKPLSAYVTNISRQWRRLTKRANLSQKIEGHNYTELHGHVLRKFFQTNCKLSGCRADFVDFWMGHHPVRQEEYLNDSYFRPSTEQHLKEYRKAAFSLSVFEVEELKQQYEDKLKNLEGRLHALIAYVENTDEREEKRINELVEKVSKRLFSTEEKEKGG